MTPLYYRGANVTILVYSVICRETFKDISEVWFNQVRMHNSETFLVLIGNKTDLEDFREVSNEEGQQLAERIGAMFWETSAKTGQNVHAAFEGICKKLDESDKLSMKESDKTPTSGVRKDRSITVLSNDGKPVEVGRSRIQCCS